VTPEIAGARQASRRRSRQAALQMLYAVDVAQRGGPAQRARLAADVFETASVHVELPEGARVFAKELVTGVTERLAELDAAIVRHARNWRLERMAAVDRNVLRLGAWEILYGGAPPEIAIDEAVELARRFGGERSPAFVNGILDAIFRERRDAAEPGGSGGEGTP
jgi:N utilization substance protein B